MVGELTLKAILKLFCKQFKRIPLSSASLLNLLPAHTNFKTRSRNCQLVFCFHGWFHSLFDLICQCASIFGLEKFVEILNALKTAFPFLPIAAHLFLNKYSKLSKDCITKQKPQWHLTINISLVHFYLAFSRSQLGSLVLPWLTLVVTLKIRCLIANLGLAPSLF